MTTFTYSIIGEVLHMYIIPTIIYLFNQIKDMDQKLQEVVFPVGRFSSPVPLPISKADQSGEEMSVPLTPNIWNKHTVG